VPAARKALREDRHPAKDGQSGTLGGTGAPVSAYLNAEVETMEPRISRNFLQLAAVGAGLVLALGVSGCRVHVDKDANGKDKTVQVDTPFGGVHVNTDQISASDLGMPVYPGAKPVTDDDKHKSADVHLGFGDWQLRVKAVSYGSSDSKDKVAAFYKKALARYGDVVTCDGNNPVGTPVATREGLTCSDNDSNGQVKLDSHDFRQDFQLKAGSKRHQHIVGFEDSKGGETRFALVALDLPANITSDDDKKQ
jgi:hypothetical protein